MTTENTKKTRTESDLIGAREVPYEALYGVQTLRGMENFPISHFKLSQYPLFIKGLGVTKLGAVRANHKLGLIPDDMAPSLRLLTKGANRADQAEQDHNPRSASVRLRGAELISEWKDFS